MAMLIKQAKEKRQDSREKKRERDRERESERDSESINLIFKDFICSALVSEEQISKKLKSNHTLSSTQIIALPLIFFFLSLPPPFFRFSLAVYNSTQVHFASSSRFTRLSLFLSQTRSIFFLMCFFFLPSAARLYATFTIEIKFHALLGKL